MPMTGTEPNILKTNDVPTVYPAPTKIRIFELHRNYLFHYPSFNVEPESAEYVKMGNKLA